MRPAFILARSSYHQAEISIEPIDPPDQVKRGEIFSLKFLVKDLSSDQPVDGLEDFVISINQLGGNWNQRYLAVSAGNGIYEIQTSIPQAGNHNVLLGVSSRNLGLDAMAPINVHVVE